MSPAEPPDRMDIDPHGGGTVDDAFAADHARARLEDLLLSLPFDRALPDLDALLARAGVPAELLRRDERVLKVLQEAIAARPFADLDEVRRTRTEVELLTLEVEVLTDRLQDPSHGPEDRAEVLARLQVLRRRLDEVRGLL